MSESGFLCQGKRSFKKGDMKVREINLVQFASVVISSSIAPNAESFTRYKSVPASPLRKKLKTNTIDNVTVHNVHVQIHTKSDLYTVLF